MQCFENVGAGKCPKCPPWLRAWVDAYACCAIVRWFCSNNFLWLDVQVMQQRPYANPSVSPLSLDQSQQSDSPNGKITPAVLLHLMPNRHFFVNFRNAKRLCLFCLMKQAGSVLPSSNRIWPKAKQLQQFFCLKRQNKNT